MSKLKMTILRDRIVTIPQKLQNLGTPGAAVPWKGFFYFPIKGTGKYL